MRRVGVLYMETGTSQGGSFESLFQTLRVLDRRSYDPIVVYLNPNRFTDELNRMGIWNYVLFDPVYSRQKGSVIPRILSKGSQLAGAYGGRVSILYEFLTHFSTIVQIGRVVNRHAVRILHANDQINRDFFCLFVCAFKGIRCISHIRSPDTRGFNKWKAGYANARVWRYVSYSEERRDVWIKAGLESTKCSVVCNGIDTTEEVRARNISQAYGLTRRGPVIGSVGTVIPERGYDFLVKSFKLLLEEKPDCTLLIVGGGTKKNLARLSDLIRSLNLHDQVLLPGPTPDGKGTIAALDVLVLPYRNEPFGRTLLEAWLVGTPVIATDFGGIGKVIRRGENGLLVSYGDVAGLKSAILSILDDRALRERFREEGRRTVRQGFDIRKTVGQIEALYRECMDLAATDGSRSRKSFVRDRVGQS